jgi:hypothetical protein
LGTGHAYLVGQRAADFRAASASPVRSARHHEEQPPMPDATPRRHPEHQVAFLVRLWRDHEGAPWRASATHVRTGERSYFASLEHLYVFLHDEAATGPAESSRPEPDRGAASPREASSAPNVQFGPSNAPNVQSEPMPDPANHRTLRSARP